MNGTWKRQHAYIYAGRQCPECKKISHEKLHALLGTCEHVREDYSS